MPYCLRLARKLHFKKQHRSLTVNYASKMGCKYIMSRSAFDAHTDPLFKNVGIPSLESIYKPQIGKFIYQYKSGLFPNSFNNMFLVTRQVHSYGARSSQLFYLQQCRTTIRKFSVSFQGSKIFNSLSIEIRNATSTSSFAVS